ncbi:MAG: beta-N-acetylhexosaminidase [Bacteroidales bacterium]
MRRLLIITLLSLLCGSIYSRVSVLPKPEQVKEMEGEFAFNKHTKVYYDTEEQKEATSFFIQKLGLAMGSELQTSARIPKKNALVFKYTDGIEDEGYTLLVTPERIQIEASSKSGFFYASQTLMQLLPVDIFRSVTLPEVEWAVPAVEIQDSPKYPYRGFMLDVARYFLPKDEVLKLIDYMAIHKINKLHWHLVDDNGWRIEIKKYPLLGTVGGYRVKREGLFPHRQNPKPGEPTPVGGFYSQDEIREVVKYAQDRCIEVIPEIEMPAHTVSSLAAYPHLTCPVVNEFIGTLPGIGGKNASIIYCAGNDQVFDFLQDVIDEVSDLFPSNYIHIGGDEAWKDNWKKCPLCQKRMKEANIPNEEELQSYFIRRMNAYIKTKGKSLMGWDELTDSEIPEGATIFGWRGFGQSAAKAARKGHDVVLTPARIMYLIRYQGPQWFEPFTYFGNNTLRDVYNYEVGMSDFTPELMSRIKGLQASMWTEFINSPEELQYMVFPRLAALADIAWSKQDKDWPDFLTRLDKMSKLYDITGVNYAQSMFNIFHKISAGERGLCVDLSCIRPDVQIRYTLDGTMPSMNSPVFNGNLALNKGEVLLAQTFLSGEPKGQLLSLVPQFSLATGAKINGNAENMDCLVNGILGTERYTDGEYVNVYDQDLTFTMDLHAQKNISKIILGSLINAGMAVCYPESVLIESSQDGENFSLLTERFFDPSERFPNSFTKSQLIFDDFQSLQTQFIRISVKKPGLLPEGTPREQQIGRMAFDEVLIF